MSQEPASKPRIRTDILFEIVTAAAFVVVASVIVAGTYGSSQSIYSVIGHYVLTAEHR
jgi:hypothetical protein